MAGQVVYCETCKADREVRSVEALSDGRKLKILECGHFLKMIIAVVDERVQTSESVSWLLLKDPVAETQKAVKDNDHFKTVAYACSVFEYCGKQILVWHSRNAGCPISEET